MYTRNIFALNADHKLNSDFAAWLKYQAHDPNRKNKKIIFEMNPDSLAMAKFYVKTLGNDNLIGITYHHDNNIVETAKELGISLIIYPISDLTYALYSAADVSFISPMLESNGFDTVLTKNDAADANFITNIIPAFLIRIAESVHGCVITEQENLITWITL